MFFSACTKPINEIPLSLSQLPEIDKTMEPGLRIYYKYAFYRHLNQMASDEDMVLEGIEGQPVALLNHQFNKGEVYDSQKNKGVGVFLSGYLKMAVPGKYRFRAMSNDGIRVAVNQEIVVFDPEYHSDRLSDVGEIQIDNPRWYPITIKYFQRKGTARLELYWQPPGAQAFEIIPSSVYGHSRSSVN